MIKGSTKRTFLSGTYKVTVASPPWGPNHVLRFEDYPGFSKFPRQCSPQSEPVASTPRRQNSAVIPDPRGVVATVLGATHWHDIAG